MSIATHMCDKYIWMVQEKGPIVGTEGQKQMRCLSELRSQDCVKFPVRGLRIQEDHHIWVVQENGTNGGQEQAERYELQTERRK